MMMMTMMMMMMTVVIINTIERFHSRGQHPCKFIGTKESVCIRKEFNSHRIILVHQHGRRFIVWNTNMAPKRSINDVVDDEETGKFSRYNLQKLYLFTKLSVNRLSI